MMSYPYYDERGDYHHHDTNIVRVTYQCSQGHTWIQKVKNRCDCGWIQKFVTYETQEGEPVVSFKYNENGSMTYIDSEGYELPVRVRVLTNKELIEWIE